MTFQQMTSVRCAIVLADNDMCVEFVLTIFRHNDVSRQRDYFDLSRYRNSLIVFAVTLKEAERAVAECANSSKMAGAQFVLFRKAEQCRSDFIAFVEDQCERLLCALTYQFRLHPLALRALRMHRHLDYLRKVQRLASCSLRYLFAATESISDDQSVLRSFTNRREQD